MTKKVPNNMDQALFDAAVSDNAEKIAALVAAGSDVHSHDEHGRTCLHHVAQRDCRKSIVALISAGANPDQFDAVGWTPMNLASYFNRPHAISELVLCGARVDIADDRQDLPIDLAMCEGRREATLMLRACGSPPPARVQPENEGFVEILALSRLEAAVLTNKAALVQLALADTTSDEIMDDAALQQAAERAEKSNKGAPGAYLRSVLAQKAARAALDEIGLSSQGAAP